jgi:tripartite-type tricarboxylate transporter receptor subunit TctC
MEGLQMKENIRPVCISVIVVLLALAWLSSSWAADYPTEKPVTFIIDGSPGGGSDIWSRTFLRIAEKHLNAKFVAENHPGGASAVAFSQTLKQKADGYTIGTVTPQFIVTPLTQPLGFDRRAFEPIATILNEKKVIFVKPGTYKTLNDIIQDARARPGKQKWAMYGTGSDEHIVMNRINKQAKVVTEQVPYGGSGEVAVAVLGGHVHVGIAKPSVVINQIQQGLLVPIAVDGSKRNAYLKDVPCLGELGYDIEIPTWRGFVAKKGTPRDRITYLANGFKKVLDDQEFKDFIGRLKYEVFYLTGEDLNKFLDKEEEKFKVILSEMKLK